MLNETAKADLAAKLTEFANSQKAAKAAAPAAKAKATKTAKAVAAPAPKPQPVKAAPAPVKTEKVLSSVPADMFILTDFRGNALPFKYEGQLVYACPAPQYPGNMSGNPAYAKGARYMQYHRNTRAAFDEAFNRRSKTKLLQLAAHVFHGPATTPDGLDWSGTYFVAEREKYEAYLVSVGGSRPK